MPTTRVLPAVAAAALLAGLLTACGPSPESSPTPEPAPTGSGSSSETPTATPGGGETPGPTTPAAPTLSSADRASIRDAITSGNTAALEGYFSDPVRVIFMASECCFDVTPAAAVDAMSRLSTAAAPWDFDLPASTLDFWRSNQYYGYLFTGDDISGLAADGTVVNLGIAGDRITTVLIGFEEGFTH